MVLANELLGQYIVFFIVYFFLQPLLYYTLLKKDNRYSTEIIISVLFLPLLIHSIGDIYKSIRIYMYGGTSILESIISVIMLILSICIIVQIIYFFKNRYLPIIQKIIALLPFILMLFYIIYAIATESLSRGLLGMSSIITAISIVLIITQIIYIFRIEKRETSMSTIVILTAAFIITSFLSFVTIVLFGGLSIG